MQILLIQQHRSRRFFTVAWSPWCPPPRVCRQMRSISNTCEVRAHVCFSAAFAARVWAIRRRTSSRTKLMEAEDGYARPAALHACRRLSNSSSGGLAPYTCRHQAASWMLAALHCSSGTPADKQLQRVMPDAVAIASLLSGSASASRGDSVRVLACPLSLLSITHFNSLLADGSLCCR